MKAQNEKGFIRTLGIKRLGSRVDRHRLLVIPCYFDIARRDFGLPLGPILLTQLSSEFPSGNAIELWTTSCFFAQRSALVH